MGNRFFRVRILVLYPEIDSSGQRETGSRSVVSFLPLLGLRRKHHSSTAGQKHVATAVLATRNSYMRLLDAGMSKFAHVEHITI